MTARRLLASTTYPNPEFEYGFNPKAYSDSRTASLVSLLAQVRDPGLTHIVREVDVVTRPGKSTLEMHPDETWEDLALVGEQFTQLETLTDLRVAPTQWHVFQDERGLTRTLARVEIVEGDDRILPDVSNLEELSRETSLSPHERELGFQLFSNLDIYFEHTVGRPLHDIDRMSQYKFGVLRSLASNPLANQALYLVDIDPILMPESYMVDEG